MRAHPGAWRAAALALVLVLYLALTLGVVFRSPVIRLDRDFFRLDLRGTYPDWKPWIQHYVIFGQRGPATLVFLPYFCWVAWRTRSTRPLVMLATAFVLLNLSVGVVKLATGRLGPRQTTHAHEILVGGDIYPSGHVSNAVVLYGLIALIAIKHRVFAAWAAVFLSVTVGLGTVYLDTHWFSDIVGGWFAGAVVLLVLPSVMPFTQRWVDALLGRVLLRWRRRRAARSPRRPAAVVAPASAERSVVLNEAPTPASPGPPSSAVVAPRAGQLAGQSAKNVTPVRSRARSHSMAAATGSREALDDRTTCG